MPKIEISDEHYDAISALKMPKESDDDIIERLLAAVLKQRLSVVPLANATPKMAFPERLAELWVGRM